MFDESRAEYEADRAELRELPGESEYRAVIDAHYADPALLAKLWQTLNTLGFTDGRLLDPVAAGISPALYPGADIPVAPFTDTGCPSVVPVAVTLSA